MTMHQGILAGLVLLLGGSTGGSTLIASAAALDVVKPTSVRRGFLRFNRKRRRLSGRIKDAAPVAIKLSASTTCGLRSERV